MDVIRHLDIEDLRQLCREKEVESLTLEFKPCQELKVGTEFHDNKRGGELRERQLDDVLAELTKDVTALLNSAGGTIIYGILQDKRSRAKKLDSEPFRSDPNQDNVSPERVVDWLRYHVEPSPSVDVYPIFEDTKEKTSWYLVIEVPQGQLAYQAKDWRFYKRVGATAQPMEQYEVADVMNRTRAAMLGLRIAMEPDRRYISDEWRHLILRPEVTSQNYIASEYGALRLIIARPLHFAGSMKVPGVRFESSASLRLVGEVAHAMVATLRWGAHNGTVVLSGDWYDFQRVPLPIGIPGPSVLPGGTYLMKAELFTMDSRAREQFFAIKQVGTDEFDISLVHDSNYASTGATFWATYHKAYSKGLFTRQEQ